ncbi:SDR family oxidoreductase [Variovorax sp. J31P179]|uniref:SDR family NAD(P)-dependent oxidoreductase n=1 Tax=Variovorax sp. J31P179 TaxID=3053508 RepID=UPI0025788193|nr:SDR family oxidoreductase [Variovorax sp. J31P179]MDM0084735.1 SDR family oxidoreductase [Variovorax sp. J31P179]
MSSNWNQSTYVVLGGTGAIGHAICRSLATSGHAIHFTFGSRLSAAQELAASIEKLGGKASYQQVAWGDAKAFAALSEKLTEIEDLRGAVYATGPDIEQPFLSQVAPSRWNEVLQQDVMTFLSFAHLVVPLLRAAKGSSFVAITTAATQRHPARDALSSVPKAAVQAAIRGLAREEGRFGIRANCVAPGMLDTGLGQRMMDNHFDATAIEKIRQSVPLQFFGNADDIAAAVVFLLSPAARYITGQTLCVDGGWTV